MEPRDEDAENMLAGFIRGPGGDPDVTKWMNNSGEGDPELARRDGSDEGEAYTIVQGDDDGEADGSVEGKADGANEGDTELARRDSFGEGEVDGSGRTLEITNSGELHMYVN